jgi:hypothetical protein
MIYLELKGLRKAHLQQLLDYVEHREREGWYYGNRKQYEKRHAELKAWLEQAVDHAYSEGVVMPK